MLSPQHSSFARPSWRASRTARWAVGLGALPRAGEPPQPGAADQRVGERAGRGLLALVDQLVERRAGAVDPLGERERHAQVGAQLQVGHDLGRARRLVGGRLDVVLGRGGIAEEDERGRPRDPCGQAERVAGRGQVERALGGRERLLRASGADRRVDRTR